jgi:hypothetical protein
MNGYTVIDTDGHVFEPESMWQDYLEPAYRDRCPRIVRDKGSRTHRGETARRYLNLR